VAVTSPTDVAERLTAIQNRIRAAGGRTEGITIVAVTKGHGPEAVVAAARTGLLDVGENYAGELLSKRAATDTLETPLRWHFLGHVQRNKVRALGPAVHLWQGVDRYAAGAEIAERAPAARVLVQVNLSGRPERNGCPPDDAPALVRDLRVLGLDVGGLMAMGPHGPAEEARAGFRRLVRMADDLGLPVRSMGMTGDLEVAVEEGTTMVRIGRGLFGPRPEPPGLQR
jgi:PLP dependent protein